MRKNKRSVLSHFKVRMDHRFGIVDLTGKEIDDIVALVKSGRIAPAYKQSNARRWYRVPIRDKIVYVLFNKSRGFGLTTVLTEEMFKEEFGPIKEEETNGGPSRQKRGNLGNTGNQESSC